MANPVSCKVSVVHDYDMKTFTAIAEMETEGAISQAEYDIYTAICQETNLFLSKQNSGVRSQNSE